MLAVALGAAGCGPTVGDGWMLGIHSTQDVGTGTATTVEHYAFFDDGTVELSRHGTSGEQSRTVREWKGTGDGTLVILAGDDPAAGRLVVHYGGECGPHTVTRWRPDGDGAEWSLYPGEVCVRVLPPCTDDPDIWPCASHTAAYERYWCAGEGPPCEE